MDCCWQPALTLAEVHCDILRWDYAGVVSGRATRSRMAFVGRVPVAFTDLRHYARVFRALLLEELRASIQQVRPSVTGKVTGCEIVCGGSQPGWLQASSSTGGTDGVADVGVI